VTPGGGAFGCLVTGFLLAVPVYLVVHLIVAVAR
jgi:hypothetical protein